jgi:hypothetical protein
MDFSVKFLQMIVQGECMFVTSHGHILGNSFAPPSASDIVSFVHCSTVLYGWFSFAGQISLLSALFDVCSMCCTIVSLLDVKGANEEILEQGMFLSDDMRYDLVVVVDIEYFLLSSMTVMCASAGLTVVAFVNILELFVNCGMIWWLL